MLSPAYGDDALSAEAETALQNLFETECAVFFVTTGTAANALVLSAICPPWGAVYCHVDAHILNDENTAVETVFGWRTVGGYRGSRR
jgi:threonine aldolase